jgi:anti-anti-sigma factor
MGIAKQALRRRRLLECTMSAAIASFPVHPLLSPSLVSQMGGAGSMLRVTIERSGTAVLLYAAGEVDGSNESIWRRLLCEAATATAVPGPLLIDTNGLDFMAGCAYAALTEEADRCRARGINLCLVSVQRIVTRVVGVLKLDRQLPLYDNVEAALMATLTLDPKAS